MEGVTNSSTLPRVQSARPTSFLRPSPNFQLKKGDVFFLVCWLTRDARELRFPIKWQAHCMWFIFVLLDTLNFFAWFLDLWECSKRYVEHDTFRLPDIIIFYSNFRQAILLRRIIISCFQMFFLWPFFTSLMIFCNKGKSHDPNRGEKLQPTNWPHFAPHFPSPPFPFATE